MTVAVQDGAAAVQPGWAIAAPREILVEKKCLLREAPGSLVIRKQAQHFIAENGGAARLQEDDGRPGVDFRSESFKDFRQPSLCPGQHAVVVQRPAATE